MRTRCKSITKTPRTNTTLPRYLRRPLLAQPERQGREEVSGNQTFIRPPTHDTTTTRKEPAALYDYCIGAQFSSVFLDTMSNPPYTIDSGLTGYPESRAGAPRHERWMKEAERATEEGRKNIHTGKLVTQTVSLGLSTGQEASAVDG